MFEKSEQIQRAVAKLESLGVKFSDHLKKAIQDLASPQYRVAVVGEYQVGKSTLINKVFLAEDGILVTGNGLCTTSVVTEVRYGATRKLTAYQWDYEGGEEERRAAVLEQREKLYSQTENPTQANVKAATVAADTGLKAREELSKKLSRVCLEVPAESLKGYTLLDTPGLDDPSEELLANTTYRVIPQADLAIVVVSCNSLNQRVMNLIRKDLVGDGISRFMVLISYQPMSDRSPEMRQDIIQEIQNQLEGVGLSRIPVDMYCFDESVEDILCNVDEIRLRISSFLEQNALLGREERVLALLHRELSAEVKANAARIQGSALTPEQRQAQMKKIEEAENTFHRQFQESMENVQGEIEALKARVSQRVEDIVEEVFLETEEKLKEQKTFSEMQGMLETSGRRMSLALSNRLLTVQAEVKQGIRQIREENKLSIQKPIEDFNVTLDKELEINGGMLAKVPGPVWEVANVTLLNALLPGGWIFATVGRVILNQKFLLQGVAKKAVERKVGKEMSELRENVASQVTGQLQENIDACWEDWQEELLAENAEQGKKIREAFKESDGERKEQIKKWEALQGELTSILTTLQA